MKKTATFLLGSLVGAALGYLASRKAPRGKMESIPESILESVPASVPVSMPESAPASVDPASVRVQPVAAPLPGEGPVAEPVLLPESEVIITSDFLEEPLPGCGWEPSAGIAIAEDTMEEILSTAPDTFEPYEPVEVERESPPARDKSAGAVYSWPKTEKPAKEAGTDLEAEAGIGLPPGVAGGGEGEPATITEPEVVLVEEGDVAALAISDPVEVSFELPLETAEASEVTIEVPLETRVAPPPGVEQPRQTSVREPGAAAGAAAPALSVDELKARIEETRRRIQRELEQPFVFADEVAEEANGEAQRAATPATAAPDQPGRALREDGPSVPVAPPPTMGPDTDKVSVQAIDYEAVKARIELTRSRLKAKAFDAMMMGEAALLGRETENVTHSQPQVSPIDREIEEAIESRLREEEDEG